MDLTEIQHAIEELPKDEQAALAAWIAARDQAEWEAEIERDFSPGGRGGALLAEMKADARAQAMEDKGDIADAATARKEAAKKGTKSFAKLRAELGE